MALLPLSIIHMSFIYKKLSVNVSNKEIAIIVTLQNNAMT
jgi:hypothetical protein